MKKKLDPWEKDWVAMVSSQVIHIVPVDDEKQHVVHGLEDCEHKICSCEPEPLIINSLPIWVHNAYDCREAVQQALEILDQSQHNHYNDDIE